MRASDLRVGDYVTVKREGYDDCHGLRRVIGTTTSGKAIVVKDDEYRLTRFAWSMAAKVVDLRRLTDWQPAGDSLAS